jgi:hypothetical protein
VALPAAGRRYNGKGKSKGKTPTFRKRTPFGWTQGKWGMRNDKSRSRSLVVPTTTSSVQGLSKQTLIPGGLARDDNPRDFVPVNRDSSDCPSFVRVKSRRPARSGRLPPEEQNQEHGKSKTPTLKKRAWGTRLSAEHQDQERVEGTGCNRGGTEAV